MRRERELGENVQAETTQDNMPLQFISCFYVRMLLCFAQFISTYIEHTSSNKGIY